MRNVRLHAMVTVVRVWPRRHKTHAMAVMAWIAAHASSDGSGIEFNPEVWASLADEIGLTPEEGKAAVDALIAEGDQ